MGFLWDLVVDFVKAIWNFISPVVYIGIGIAVIALIISIIKDKAKQGEYKRNEQKELTCDKIMANRTGRTVESVTFQRRIIESKRAVNAMKNETADDILAEMQFYSERNQYIQEWNAKKK